MKDEQRTKNNRRRIPNKKQSIKTNAITKESLSKCLSEDINIQKNGKKSYEKE